MEKIIVPEWYRQAKASHMSSQELNRKLHAYCRDALIAGGGGEPSEELIALTAEMYEHALTLGEGDA